MLQENKTIEVHGYGDDTAKTELNIQDEIILQQIDLQEIKIFLKHGIFYFEGYIRHGDEINAENILKLNKWSRESGNSKECIKSINLKIARNGYVIRHYVFRAYIVDYVEHFNNGKHRFNLILRQYKLARLDGARGDTGATKTESFIKTMDIKGLTNTVIMEAIEPIDWGKITSTAFLTGSNALTAIGMKSMLSVSNPIALKFFLIAHGTGLVSEFMADVYFTATGNPDKIGSFNMTRDHFYKPLGKIVKKEIERMAPIIKLSNTLGEDVYNMGNLAFSGAELGKIGVKIFKDIKSVNGLGFFYKIKIKEVKTSVFGRKLVPSKYVGLTPIKATMAFAKDMGLDSYSFKKSAEGEVNKRKNKDEKVWIKNITPPNINKE